MFFGMVSCSMPCVVWFGDVLVRCGASGMFVCFGMLWCSCVLCSVIAFSGALCCGVCCGLVWSYVI